MFKNYFIVKDGEVEEKKLSLSELVHLVKNSISLESKQFGFEKARGRHSNIKIR